MTALYATLRLAWRPLTLLLLGTVWLVVAFLLQVIPDVSEVMPIVRALWLGTATPVMVKALWVVLAIAPAGIGLIVAESRLDLQHTTLSWHLPDVRRRLFAGTVACALVVGVVSAALMARNAPPALTVAAFPLAAYAFLMPGFCFDVVVSRAARILIALPFLAVLAWPGTTMRLANEYPALAMGLGLALAGLQLAAITSTSRARLRPFRWSALRRSRSSALYWESRKAQRRDWRQSLATDRLVPWLRAALYESSRRYPLAHLAHAAFVVVLARLVDSAMLVPILAGSFLMQGGLQLHARMPYPLPRIRRAQLVYAGTVIEALTYFVIFGALLYATSRMRLPLLPGVERDATPLIEWGLAWGCSFALVPIVQWASIRWPDHELRQRMMIGYFALLLAYGFVVVLTADALEPALMAGDPGRSWIAIGVIAMVAQLTHATLVYARYTRGDLVRTDSAR